MARPPRRRRGDLLVAAAVALLVTGLSLLQLFLGPDLGLADNGDGRRVLCGAGLQPPPAETTFTEVVFEVGELTNRAAGRCDDPDLRYSTSQIVLVDTVRLADGLFSAPGIDLRWVGVLVSVLLGLGFGALYVGLGGARPFRLLAVGAAAAMALDVSYVHYSSSAFSESAGFLGLVWTAAGLAWLARRPLGLPSLGVLFVATTLLVTAKSQLTTLAVVVVAAVLLRAWQHHRGPDRGRRRPLVLAGLFIVALVSECALQLAYQGPDFHRANVHNLILYTVAPLSGDPGQALADMGFEPALTEYAGTNAFDHEAGDDPVYQDFLRQADRGTAAAYLVDHPDLIWTMLETGVDESTHPRTVYLAEIATDDRTAGDPQADRWSPATDLLDRLVPVAWPLLPWVWLVLVASGLVLSVRRTVRGADMRAWGYPLTFTAVAAAAQVPVSLIGDGFYELAKHEVYVSYLTWLAVALWLGSLLRIAFPARRSPAAAGATDTGPGAVPEGDPGPATAEEALSFAAAVEGDGQHEHQPNEVSPVSDRPANRVARMPEDAPPLDEVANADLTRRRETRRREKQ